MHHYTESGLDHVWLRNGFVVQDFGAYGRAVAVADERALWRVLGRAIARQDRRMTGQELRFLRSVLDWTQTDLGVRLGYADHQMVARWERNRHAAVPLHADVLLRACYLESLGEAPMVGRVSHRLAELATVPASAPEAKPRRVLVEHRGDRWVAEEAPAEMELA